MLKAAASIEMAGPAITDVVQGIYNTLLDGYLCDSLYLEWKQAMVEIPIIFQKFNYLG